ncbi:hypothetical protein C8J56DRAFT_834456 [Mycena floridula]|nr:hypothetical protein C8J56DRAFT_834456 [Mycena floridula]
MVNLWLPLILASSVSAQYFSDGWKPGQKVTEEPNLATGVPILNRRPAPKAAPPPPQRPTKSIFDLERLLSSEPLAKLFSKAGINITEKLAIANDNGWDPRIPLITDNNFNELIVNEALTEEEEKERVWAIVVSAATAREGGVSKFVDEMFDDSYNMSVIADDLPNVRWGRIDYLNVTYVTTKWGVWQAPLIVIAQERGQSLRFYKPQHLRLRDGGLREFLKQEIYKLAAPWNSSFAPGGSREYILHFYATWMAKLYEFTVWIPRWLLYIISGSMASVVINFMHRGDRVPPPRPKPEEAEPAASPPVASATTTQVAASTQGPAKKRKNKK